MSLVSRQMLSQWLSQSLEIYNFKDYAPNGLQLQGKPFIKKVVMGVTASKALLEHAAHIHADAVIVHHGWFWKNENPCITSMKYERIAYAIQQELNIFAYHLPLDAHPVWGNNAQLARVLGLQVSRVDNKPETCGQGNLIWMGSPPDGLEKLGDLELHIATILQRKPLFIGNKEQRVSRIAWCTGGAQSFFEDAIAAGAEAFITGEASEQNFHIANETGVAFFAAGHHATERYGVQALGHALKEQFPALEVVFVDIPNPI
ncbi:Nif3-like dinuclear metal center hexameric protein [Pelistega europaea]|uniref:Nif3-like dinuclear metal center hexameric protein n=1 Tax=Pelistega europaea TaxID=106147 RepID=A0A7Y4LB74_9BURK|nr:Nif3-like dinuclear metal center hexameric protein [Pelistega europaea]NOL50359.1 Nif3-like dinuclear metal center hexameric protein [Pelistega europaea]